MQTLSHASSTMNDNEQPQTLSSVLTSPSLILKLVFLSALSLGPVLYRDKLKTVLGGSASSASTPTNEVQTPLMHNAGSVEMEAVESIDSDPSHLLPLSYTPTPVTPTSTLSPFGRASLEEGSTTDVDGDEEVTVTKKTSFIKRCPSKKGSRHEKKWSVPWIMWGNNDDERCDGSAKEEKIGLMMDEKSMIREESA